MQICSNCSFENEQDAKNCINCGQPLNGDDVMPAQIDEQNEVVATDLFVGKKADYYNQKWEKAEKKNGLSFNVAPFFLSFAWLGYRKMYKVILLMALSFLVVDFALFLLKYEYPTNFSISPIDRAIGSAVAFILAFYGNTLYKKHAEDKIEAIDENIIHADEREEQYKKKGGTSWLGVLFGILIMLGVYWVPSFFIPMHVNPIEGAQTSTMEYSENNQAYTVKMGDLLEDVFIGGKWDYEDKSVSKETVVYTAEYEEDGYTYDFEVYFYVEDYADEIFVTDIVVDGEALYFDEDFDELDFLLSLME